MLDLRLTRAHLRPGLAQLRFRQPEPCIGLIPSGLEWPRIDLEEEVAGSHERALPIVLAHEVPSDPGADLGIDVSDQCPHPLRGDRDVLFDHGRDPDHGWWRWGGGAGSVTAAGERGRREHDDEQACPWRARDERPLHIRSLRSHSRM